MKDPIRITTLTGLLGRIRRVFSKSEWVIWLLGLSRANQNPTETGLILVQIDGLSKTQFEHAVESGRMPFLKALIEKEKYIKHTLYSGLPSSTPSVQGELFYGARTIVPAFGFRDHRSGRLVRMFASEIAQDIEAKLSEQGPGLLDGGSSYSNIYSGGAKDVHFCATSFGWSEFFKTVNPFQMLLLFLLNAVMFLRITGLMLLELSLAIIDFIRGIFSGREFWQELVMIPARVAVVVFLRELVTIGACFDAARGQPIIHLNLLGYDEQAHRRGPDSRFAHWTLRAIDKSIRRIWKAAHNGAGREYDVWVYSDHGQEKTRPYQLNHGVTIQKVVAEMVEGSCPAPTQSQYESTKRIPTRANWLGIGWLVSILFGEQDHDIQTRSSQVQTVTSGPLGFVYLLSAKLRSRRVEFAERMVKVFQVPMAVVAHRAAPVDGLSDTGPATLDGQHLPTATVFTAEGRYELPRDAVQVFGAEHPFLPDIAADLIHLVQHPDAGEIVLIGWSRGAEGKNQSAHDLPLAHLSQRENGSTSFVLQHGAHAGPGSEETRAFALLPPDITVGEAGQNYLRPNDLRLAALRFLGRDKPRQASGFNSLPRSEKIQLLTYNVHACVGMDGQLSPERIARVIAQSGADIVCLQELDVFRYRSGNRDQAHAIAKRLEMQFEFHPAWHLEEEQFGNAVLTRFPMKVVAAKGLHHHKSDRSRRSALWVEVEISKDVTWQIINTHLSIYPTEQLIQAKELIEEWVQPASLLGPVILCGDLNARPGSKTCAAFRQCLANVESFDRQPTRPTYFSPFPFSRVDHIFVSGELAATQTQVIDTRIAKLASDHLPLSVELSMPNRQK